MDGTADRARLHARVTIMVAATALMAGCPRHGMVDDGTSVSYGPSNRGKLLSPAHLPARGEGYFIPSRWAKRGLNYGTDEMVALIIHTGRRIGAASPGSQVAVADLSRRRGGPSAWHRSHQTGRDADILFFVRDHQGNPLPSQTMMHFRADGTALMAGAGEGEGEGQRLVYFDVERNWLLVRTLLENPIAELQYIFVYEPLKQKLLDHARAMGEPWELIAQASFILHQPGDSLPHDDHFHMRIYCSLADRMLGCSDRGALRWTKKLYKYDMDRAVESATPVAMRAALNTPMPAMMALGVFPFLP